MRWASEAHVGDAIVVRTRPGDRTDSPGMRPAHRDESPARDCANTPVSAGEVLTVDAWIGGDGRDARSGDEALNAAAPGFG